MYGGPPQVAAGVREGDVLAGKYRVDRVLGVGRHGRGRRGSPHRAREQVALKFLLPEALGNEEAVAGSSRGPSRRKDQERARRARLDVGTLENGAPYMVMEYLEGGDLAAWLEQQGALPVEQAVDFVLQACVAVADAHASASSTGISSPRTSFAFGGATDSSHQGARLRDLEADRHRAGSEPRAWP